MVYYNGTLYVFKQDHPAGAWNENHVVSSSMSAQIELLPDQIIEYVGEQGYNKTYIQATDPALDADKHVTTGDYWIKKADAKLTWGDVKGSNNSGNIWDNYLTGKWADLYIGISEIYCRNAQGQWIQVYNTDIIATAYTQIRQTQYEIIQEAYRANAAEGELQSRVTQTADSIRQEVIRATSAEASMLQKSDLYQTVDDIISDAQGRADAAAESAKSASIARTGIYQDAQSIVNVAVTAAKTSASETYIAQTETIQTADKLISTAVEMAGESASNTYLAKTPAYDTVSAIIDEAQSMADAAATSAKNASIARTQTYQDADSIVNSAVTIGATNVAPEFSNKKAYAVGDVVSYQGKVYRFTSAHAAGEWNASHVAATNLSAASALTYIAQTETIQTADKLIAVAARQAVDEVDGTYIAKASGYDTVNDILTEAQNKADAAATSAKNASIARTQTYQDADSIVNSAVATGATNVAPAFSASSSYAVGAVVSYQGKVYRFTTAHPAGEWNASHVTATNLSAASSLAYIARTTSYQTADSIVSEAERVSATNVAPAFSASSSYAVGDVVSYQGKIYRFTSEHAAGSWNANHVTETTSDTVELSRIEQSASEIKSFVGSRYGRTFTSSTDPASVSSNGVKPGDYWARQMNSAYTWSKVQSDGNWDTIKALTWGNYYNGGAKIYCRSTDNTWVLVNDSSKLDSAYSQIIQNRDMIQLEVVRANSMEGTLSSRITQTAERITSEVTRATEAEGVLRTSISQNATDISLEVERATSAEGSIRENYIAKSYVTISDNKIELSSLKFNSLGSSGSSIYITPTSVNINSGGTFSVSSGNFSIDSSGNVSLTGTITATSGSFTGSITSKSGSIGSWNIADSWLSTGSGSTCVTLVGGSQGSTSTTDWNLVKDYAMYAGASWPSEAPFKVKKDGTVYLNSLMVWNTSTNQYEPVNFSRDFSNAVSYSSGSWSGNTFNATLSIFGRSTGKYISLNTSINPRLVRLVSEGSGGRWTDARGTVWVLMNVNGVQSSEATLDVEVDAHLAYDDGVEDGAASVTLSGAWSGKSFRVSNSGNTNVETAYIDFSKSAATIKTELSSGTHKTTVTVDDVDRQASPLSLEIDATGAYSAGAAYADSLYTHLGQRELGYMDHGEFNSVGSHDWYYK